MFGVFRAMDGVCRKFCKSGVRLNREEEINQSCRVSLIKKTKTLNIRECLDERICI